MVLPSDFALDINNIKLSPIDDIENLRRSRDKLLVISNQQSIQDNIANIAKDKTNMIVAPSYEELSSLLFAKDITPHLIRLFSDTLNLKDISPYQIAGDVKKESMFFGRVEIISTIIHKDPRNYIIVGARQLGKSSLLKALDRRYLERGMVSHYITLDEDSDLLFYLSKALGVEANINAIQDSIYSSDKPIIFLIDEIDKFLENSKDIDKFTSIFRSLAQGDRAYFILAGYWELYKETLKSNSPLRNFGDIIQLKGLEIEACRGLITKPMELMGIGYSSPQIVEKIIEKSGQRSNLISVICSRLIDTIEDKTITQKDLDRVLDGGFVEYIAMSSEKLDRVITYATITKESFYQDDIYEIFDEYELDVDSREIEQSLYRLELSFVLAKNRGEYHYQVPLFVDKVKEDTKNFERLLSREIGEFKRGVV